MRQERKIVRPMKQQRRPRPAMLLGHLRTTSPSAKTTGMLMWSGKNKCFAEEEEELLIKLHALLGNRWSLIAGRLPGRTDKEVECHWSSQMRRKLKRMGINPDNHRACTLPSPDDERRGGRSGDESERPARKHPNRPRSSTSNVEDIADDCVSDAGSGCRARYDLARGLNLELTLSTPCLYFGQEERMTSH